jgi:EAL domain-containing protein (putative c-di-GMP-specific phosphodiesterase class I)
VDWRQRIEALIAGPGPHMVFQPIVRLADGVRTGWEALARFPEDRLPAGSAEAGLTDEAGFGFGPDVWFAHADLEGLGVPLEVAAITAALDRLADVPDDEYVAVNCGPGTLVSGQLAAAVAGVDLSRVVLELTEHLAIHDYPAVRRAVADLREAHSAGLCTKIPGFAADDVGAGAASLLHLLELADLLDFCKLDIALTRGIDTDDVRQALAVGLVGMGHQAGFRIVAEGVETEAQLVTLRRLGVYAAQGWHTGRPGPLPKEPPPCPPSASPGPP